MTSLKRQDTEGPAIIVGCNDGQLYAWETGAEEVVGLGVYGVWGIGLGCGGLWFPKPKTLNPKP